MNLIKILGIGSPFGDDQVGWVVADSLKNKLSRDQEAYQMVSIECYDRPGVRLIELISSAKTVFLIDAVKSECAIGTIHRLKNDEIYEFKNMLSTHAMGVAQALELGNSLKVLPEEIILYGIEIDNIVLNDSISKSVKKAIIMVVTQLKRDLDNMLKYTG